MSIQANLKEVLADLPSGVRLVAVSKFHPNEAIEEAYTAGQRIFGESKVQEMTQKYETLPKDIEWHFIGHLQTNKIKYMAPYVAMIHGIDSYKLLVEVNKQAQKCSRVIPCLLQIHIAEEETKFGFSFDECREMLQKGDWKELHHIQISGVMGMATNIDDTEQIKKEFCSLNTFFKEIKRTSFAGLSLRNPVIISSSSLTNSAEKNKKLELAGAGAIVLKSVFEEQIMMQAHHMATYDSPEAGDYLSTYVRSHAIKEYIDLIQETKRLCTIPIIASINCFSSSEWTDFARTMQDAGADALELNILSLQTEKEYQYGAFEQRHIDILSSVKKHVSIPVIIKLGTNLTNPIALINQLYANGAAAVVLFNRFYQPDINIETKSYSSGEVFSHPSDLANGLRWTAIASAQVPQIDYAISGGVHDGKAMVKAILAGASAVEVCSVIYQKGENFIESMTEELSEWMKKQGYNTISEFKSEMNALSTGESNPFERTQFMKYFSSKE